MAIPELTRERVAETLDHYCRNRVPEEEGIRISYKILGSTVLLFESRFDSDSQMSRDLPIARFKFRVESGVWELFYADKNEKWQNYFDAGLERDFQVLLDEVERAPAGIFWD